MSVGVKLFGISQVYPFQVRLLRSTPRIQRSPQAVRMPSRGLCPVREHQVLRAGPFPATIDPLSGMRQCVAAGVHRGQPVPH